MYYLEIICCAASHINYGIMLWGQQRNIFKNLKKQCSHNKNKHKFFNKNTYKYIFCLTWSGTNGILIICVMELTMKDLSHERPCGICNRHNMQLSTLSVYLTDILSVYLTDITYNVYANFNSNSFSVTFYLVLLFNKFRTCNVFFLFYDRQHL